MEAPYRAPKKKEKKKKGPLEAKGGLHLREPTATKARDTVAPYAQDRDGEEDEEESASSHSKK